MKISKKFPIIVSVCLVLIWGAFGYLCAVKSTDNRCAGPMYMRRVTLAEDVTVVDISKEIDAAVNKEPFVPAELKAGTSGTVYYGDSDFINDPYNGRHSFPISLYQDGETYRVSLVTGPESGLAANEIHITKIGSYQEFISENNQKYREGKASLAMALLPRTLIGIAAGALFSGIFWIECTIVNKKNKHPAVFILLCLLDLLLMIYPAGMLYLA